MEVIPEELPIEEIAVEERAMEIDLSRYLFILNEGIVSIEMGWERGEEIEEEIVEEMREEIEGLREEAEKQERVKLRRIAEILQEGIEKLKMGDITLSEEALLWLFEIWDALKTLSEGGEIEEEEIISLRDGLEKLEAIPIPEEIIPEVEVIPEEEISIEEKLFIKEAEEHLDLLNQIFLTMWNQLPEYDRELLIEMEHRLDALQESAHLLEYESIDRLTQRMLDVSERIRDNRIELTEDILRVFFDCFNELEISTESLILGEEISTEMIDNLEAKLQSILEEKVVMEEIPEEELVEEITPVAEEEKIPIVPPEVAIPTVRTAEVDMGRLDRLTNLVAELTISKTRLSGELSELVKGIGELMNERRKIKRFEKEFTATIEKGAEELPKPQISREFNILAQDLKTMTTDINKISSNLDKIRSELYTNTDYLSRVADELQQEIIRERILPISNLFSRFPQVVQDIAIEKGKKVELLIKGGDTRIDKAILEDIGDSLLYLIRNEINHSIETPEEREKNGKSEIGQLTLNAYHWGNSIIIEMEDDGAGIDDQLLIKQAIGRGFITQTEADQMSKKEGLELIFLPDFSSAETSEGEIGLDAVRNNVARLRGSLDIQSTVGKGAKFTIKLPLNLATTQVLMIKVSLQTFAINSDSISGIMRISERYIGRAEEGEIFKWGGQTIPLLYLKDVLNIDSSQSRKITESEKRGQRQAGLLTVIVSSAGRRIGLIVDELLSKQEIVIKGLGKYLGRVKDIAGATISSDGTVILVLDIPSLVEGVKIKG